MKDFDSHDYSNSGKHIPEWCRECMKEHITRLKKENAELREELAKAKADYRIEKATSEAYIEAAKDLAAQRDRAEELAKTLVRTVCGDGDFIVAVENLKAYLKEREGK